MALLRHFMPDPIYFLSQEKLAELIESLEKEPPTDDNLKNLNTAKMLFHHPAKKIQRNPKHCRGLSTDL